MRCALNASPSRRLALGLAAIFVGSAVAGCSQDTTRYSDDPFGNPFSSRSSDVTNSTGQTAAIETQPLPNPSPYAAPGGQNYSSYPTSYGPPRSVPAAPAPSYGSRAGYSTSPYATGSSSRSDAGNTITLQPGETVYSVSRRYGIPVEDIMAANNLADASRVQPGTRLIIPDSYGEPRGYSRAGGSNHSAPARASYPTAQTARVHVVTPGETLFSLGRRYNIRHDEIARANGLDDYAQLRVGQRVNIPGGTMDYGARGGPYASAEPARRVAAAPQPAPGASAPPQTQQVAAVKPIEAAEPEPTRSLGGSPQFRWPVRGRIISGFGAKPNGQHNDGINLAVPEGTEVKAAEGGVVAYAGNELKGYGNLVLIRHPDGWMTAYAHNSQLLVKRGDDIQRGQTIARAGQTGGVTTPQLHFEIRKGSTPVDPTPYLASL